MISEKLRYYRKKNMMSQEDLASKIHVSRQIITKWENGLIIPNIDNLIELSNLYGITVDSLLKNDYCIEFDSKSDKTDDLTKFIVLAKQNTYAKKSNKILSLRKQSHDYFYQKGNYEYFDSFVGSSKFSGQEVVYEKDNGIWSMNYYGRVLSKNFNGDFLKESLLRVSCEYPFRGPNFYQKGEYVYTNEVNGKIDWFYGKENIFYQDEKVFECLYNGGILL